MEPQIVKTEEQYRRHLDEVARHVRPLFPDVKWP